MKKIILLLTICLMFLMPFKKIKAEEVAVEPETEVVEEQAVVEVSNQDSNEVIDSKTAQEIATAIAEKYLGEYMDKQLIADLVAVVFGLLGYAGLFVTNFKFKKYKKTTSDDVTDAVKKETGDYLLKSFDKLAKDTITPLLKDNEELKKGFETIMKVLVLMQDSTPKGKIALLDYLGTKTYSEEVKEQIEETTEVIESQEEIKAEITEKVKDEYKEIF